MYDKLGKQYSDVFKYKTAAESARYKGIGDIQVARVKHSERREAIDTIFNAILFGDAMYKKIKEGKAISEYAEQQGFTPSDKKWYEFWKDQTYSKDGLEYSREDINVRRLLGIEDMRPGLTPEARHVIETSPRIDYQYERRSPNEDFGDIYG